MRFIWKLVQTPIKITFNSTNILILQNFPKLKKNIYIWTWILIVTEIELRVTFVG